MKAVDYLKAKARMTKGCCIRCDECPLSKDSNGKNVDCTMLGERYPEQAIKIVEKWAKEHPVKTYLSVLLERLPNTRFERNGTPNFCPDDVFKIKVKPSTCDEIDCIDCWNREYKEGE